MWQLIFCMFMNIMTTTCSQGPFVEQKIFRDRWMKVSILYNYIAVLNPNTLPPPNFLMKHKARLKLIQYADHNLVWDNKEQH